MLTLSRVKGWDVTHLESAGAHWDQVAEIWEGSFSNVRREVLTPGGTEWVGEAADAAADHANGEYRAVVNIAESLRAKAATARRGAQDLMAAKAAVLTEVNAALAAGFSVEEDLSVHDTALATMMVPARQAEGRAHQAAITAKAAALAALDAEVAAALSTDIAGIDFAIDGSTPLPPGDPAAQPSVSLQQFYESRLGLAARAGPSNLTQTPPPPFPLFNHPDCTSAEVRNAWLGYLGTTGGAGFGLATGGAAGGIGAGFAALSVPGAWDTLMSCYGIN